MKKLLLSLSCFLVLIVLVAFVASNIGARTINWGYFDALVIGTNSASPTMTVTSAGAVTATSVSAGALTASSAALTGKLVLQSKTKAELAASTPTAKGEIYGVSDGVMLVCVSSGTGRGAYTSPISSVTACN